jgi:hypothetical protein
MDYINKFDFGNAPKLTGEEVAERLTGILRAFGIDMLITDARVSAFFPDGSAADYQPLHLDTTL